jgi:hypothetical protein
MLKLYGVLLLGSAVERLRSWQVPEELRSIADPVLYLEDALFSIVNSPQFECIQEMEYDLKIVIANKQVLRINGNKTRKT